MNYIISLMVFVTTVTATYALTINEILSNPVGDDGGREWIEIYNDTDAAIDGNTISISIKGGSFVPVTLVSGGATIAPYSYAIIASTVSGATRFIQDYPTYSGSLFKSSISLVNTGVTSIDLKQDGSVISSLASYAAAKEGFSYALISGSYVTAVPTPGQENKIADTEETVTPVTTPTSAQSTLPQATPPSADIVLYLPTEKIAVAGAPTLFSVQSTTRLGKAIDGMSYTWGFGDGGGASGSSTLYRYLYPGRYIAQVEGTNGLIAGTGRMLVRVVSPEVAVSPIFYGKYGPYIDITNQNEYDIDLSLWKITIDGVPFSFPKNTLLAHGVTRFPGNVMGFASTTISSSTIIRLLFQNQDEVMRVTQGEHKEKKILENPDASFLRKSVTLQTKQIPKKVAATASTPLSSETVSSKIYVKQEKKDTRLAGFFRSLFSH